MLLSTLSCITKHLLNHPTSLIKLVFLIKVSSPLWSLMFLTLWTFLWKRDWTKMMGRIMPTCSHLVTANVACTISQSCSKICFDYCLQLVESFVLNPSDLRKPTKHLLWRWFFPAKPQFFVTKSFSMTSVHSHWSRSPDLSLPMDQLAIALWWHPVQLLSLSHLGLMWQVWDNFILISIAKLTDSLLWTHF